MGDIVAKLRTCAEGMTDEETLQRLTKEVNAIDGKAVFVNPMKITGAHT